jgi:hypothetical protein
VILLQHDPITHKHSLVFRHAGEYYIPTHALAPFSPTPTSFDTTLVLTTLHLESYGYFPLFLEDYELDQDLEFSFDSFKLTFQHMPHLLASGSYGMVFEHL